MNMPEGLKYTTLDEAAECLNLSKPLYGKLWSLMPPDEDIPPQGEWPEPDSADRVVRYLSVGWSKLTTEEQQEIVDAATKDGWLS